VNAAVDVNKAIAFQLTSVKIVAFTKGGVTSELELNVAVCGYEWITRNFQITHDNPLIVVG
jgi:hypothetical protein